MKQESVTSQAEVISCALITLAKLSLQGQVGVHSIVVTTPLEQPT